MAAPVEQGEGGDGRGISSSVEPDVRMLKGMRELVERGELSPVFKLEDRRDTFRELAKAHTRCKSVLEISLFAGIIGIFQMTVLVERESGFRPVEK